jgi:transcriptional regulator CtsR
MFGQSLENKDTLGAVASGAKIALGTARNILGGMGQARRENYVKNQYYEKQREGMTGAGREEMKKFGGYYQEGGMQSGMEEGQGMEQQGAGQEQQMMQEVAQMLQQGADPQQVIQQLVQMGVPQDQAVQMVQAIMQQMQGSTPQLKRGGMMYYQDGGEDEEDEEEGYGYEDEEEPNYMINKPSLMGKQQNFSEPALATSPAIESAVEATSLTKEEEETPSYDKNSARDTWVAKTGMPWSEAKRLGYTSGSAKDNMKLLSELNDSRFDKKYLRKKPLSPAKKEAEDNRTYFGGVLKEAVITAPRKIKGASRFMFTSDKAYQDYLKDNNIKNTNNNIPTFDFSPKSQQPMFRQSYQDGGEQQIAQQVAQAIQQGMQPQEAMSMLMESGMTEDQAMQLVQVIMQQIQQQGQNPQEEMSQGTPQMRKGGEMMKRADGSYSRRGLWDNIRDNAGSGNKPTKEMLEQEAKIKREYQEGGMEPGADPAEAMMQQISQMLQQGAEPEQIMQMLIEAGVPEDQAMQMVQAVMQQMEEPQGTPQMRRGGGYYQQGGEAMDEQMEGEDEGIENESAMLEQIESQVEEALKQGADPQQVLQQLVEMGIPEEQAMQMIQEILQEIQGGETGMEAPEESTPQMSKGGKYMRALVGKTIKNYTYNPKTDSYTVSYE